MLFSKEYKVRKQGVSKLNFPYIYAVILSCRDNYYINLEGEPMKKKCISFWYRKLLPSNKRIYPEKI